MIGFEPDLFAHSPVRIPPPLCTKYLALRCEFFRIQGVTKIREVFRGRCSKRFGRRGESLGQIFGPLGPNGLLRKSLKDVGERKWLKDLGWEKSGEGAKGFAKNVKMVLRFFMCGHRCVQSPHRGDTPDEIERSPARQYLVPARCGSTRKPKWFPDLPARGQASKAPSGALLAFYLCVVPDEPPPECPFDTT